MIDLRSLLDIARDLLDAIRPAPTREDFTPWPPPATPPDPGSPTPPPALLNPLELEALDKTADLWGDLCEIVDTGPSRSADLAELVAHVHAIQRAIMAQAAARAYPTELRPLGGPPPCRS